MTQGPEYALSEDIKQVFLRLMKRLAEDEKMEPFREYSFLDPNRFAFAVSTHAARTYNNVKNIAKIQNITEPVSLVTPVRYIISVYDGASDWAKLTQEQKELVLLHEVLHVDLEHEFKHPDWDKARAGRLLGHDLNDFRKMVAVLGVDWFEKAGPITPPVVGSAT